MVCSLIASDMVVVMVVVVLLVAVVEGRDGGAVAVAKHVLLALGVLGSGSHLSLYPSTTPSRSLAMTLEPLYTKYLILPRLFFAVMHRVWIKMNCSSYTG